MADEEFKSGAGAPNGGSGDATGAGSGDGNPWHHDLDADAKGWLQSKGWDKHDAKTAVVEAVRAYRGVEKLVGGDPGSLLRQPKPDAPPEEIAAFWRKLGVPEKAEGYDFSGIKHADGSALDESFTEFMRKTGLEMNLPAGAAVKFAAAMAQMADEAEATEKADADRALTAAKTELATNWGGAGSPQFETNMAVAKRAALASGVTADELTALEGVQGYTKVMSAFLKLGMGMGEHRALTSGGGSNLNADGTPKPMSVEEAQAKVTSLKMDQEWGKRWAAGGVKEANELQDALDVIVRGGRRT